MNLDPVTSIEIADETFVVGRRQLLGDGSALPVTTVVIRGPQPLVVGAGAATRRAVGDLVPLDELRWVFLSNDRPEHTSGLSALLGAGARVEVATTWLNRQVLAAGGVTVPQDRWHQIAVGDVLDTGDRALSIERPPLHVLPTTVGLLDTSTAVLWSAECWSAPFADAPAILGDEHLDAWRDAFVRFHHWLCPWVHAVDPAWWQRAVDRVARRGLAAIVPAYGPVLVGDHVDMAIEALRELPMLPPTPMGDSPAEHTDPR